MKDFDYYSKNIYEYHTYGEVRKKLLDEIDNTPMTKTEREKAIAKVDERARKIIKDINLEYNSYQAKLDLEFWKDCREELGYDKLFDEYGVSAIESYAWEQGHSGGYSNVHCHLIDIAAMAETLAKHIKKPKK